MEKIELDPNRNCLSCQNMYICKHYAGIDAAIKQPSCFNIDGNAAPNSFLVIFIAAASACTKFADWP